MLLPTRRRVGRVRGPQGAVFEGKRATGRRFGMGLGCALARGDRRLPILQGQQAVGHDARRDQPHQEVASPDAEPALDVSEGPEPAGVSRDGLGPGAPQLVILRQRVLQRIGWWRGQGRESRGAC